MLALLAPIGNAADVVDTAAADNRWADLQQQRYGDGDGPEYVDTVLELAISMLSRAGWVELGQSSWYGGVKEVLLRRGDHCLTVSYDPVTRQVQLIDGTAGLDFTLRLLSDNGVLTGDETSPTIDTSDTTVQRWGHDILIAAHDRLRGRILTLPQVDSPVRTTVLGLHPHADGTLRGPHAVELAEQQLHVLFTSTGVG
jgi:hypothetical protein